MRASSVLAIVYVLAGTTDLVAQPASSAAEVEFLKGRQLMRNSKFAEACEAFVNSHRIDPQLGTLFNIAECSEKIGKLATAWTAYREVAQRDTRADRAASAAQLAAQLEPRLPKLTIRAAVTHPGLSVTLNGVDITKLLNVETPVDLGAYVVVAEATGFPDWHRKATLTKEGERLAVTIPDLSIRPAPEPIKVDPKPPPQPPRARIAVGSRMRYDVGGSVGLYSAPPGVEIAPAAVVGAGGSVGVSLGRPASCRCDIGLAATGDVSLVFGDSAFEQLFLGPAIRVSHGRNLVRVGPGVSVLTGAGATLIGAGVDAMAVFGFAGRLGISVGLNAAISEQAPGFTGRLTTIRLDLGVSYF